MHSTFKKSIRQFTFKTLFLFSSNLIKLGKKVDNVTKMILLFIKHTVHGRLELVKHLMELSLEVFPYMYLFKTKSKHI